MVLQKVKNFFESKLSVAILFAMFFVLNIFDLFYISLAFATIYVAAIFVFCEDVKNIFAPILVVYFIIKQMENSAYYTLYITCAAVGVAFFVYFLLKSIFYKHEKLTKGKMFWFLIVFFAAILLGGIIGHFKLEQFLYLAVFCLLVYTCYFIAINYCKNLRDNLFYILLLGAFLVAFIFLAECFKTNSFIEAILNRRVIYVGAYNINVAAGFMFLGIISCFYMAFKDKQLDFVFVILAAVLLGFVVLTFSRASIVLGSAVFIGLLISTIINSKNKMIILEIGFVLCVIFAVFMLIDDSFARSLVDKLLNRIGDGANGREELWPWCFNLFKENWIFGAGFFSETPVPTISGAYTNIILAHNTILQWLTSVGVVGSLIMCVYYFGKYKIMLTNLRNAKWFSLILIVSIAASGMVDQYASMDIAFNILIVLMLGAEEIELREVNSQEFSDRTQILKTADFNLTQK